MVNKLCALVTIAGAALALGGCGTSSLYKPQLADVSKDGRLFVDLRDGPYEIDHPELRPITDRILNENCALTANVAHPFCRNPSGYAKYNGHVSTGFWANGPQFIAVVIPKEIAARAIRPPAEKDGDIVRVRIIPGPISMFVYDGVIERYDDPNRGCVWKGSHNYSGGVVCPKYEYTYEDLDQSKFR